MSEWNTEELIDTDKRFIWHPFTNMRDWCAPEHEPLVLIEGRGALLRDSRGREYIDGNSSIWTNIHGQHARPFRRSWRRHRSGAIGFNQWSAGASGGGHRAGGRYARSFYAGRINRARAGIARLCNRTEKFRSSNAGGNVNRCSWCFGFLLRATAGHVPFSRTRHSA